MRRRGHRPSRARGLALLRIVITFNYVDHLPPHFHARYGDARGTIALDGAVLAGRFPPRALALVQAWARLHREELSTDWDLARRGEPLLPISPLD